MSEIPSLFTLVSSSKRLSVSLACLFNLSFSPPCLCRPRRLPCLWTKLDPLMECAKSSSGVRRKKRGRKSSESFCLLSPRSVYVEGVGRRTSCAGSGNPRSLTRNVSPRSRSPFFGGKSGAVYIESRDDDVRAQSRYRICTMQRSFSDKREREDGCPTGCRLYRSGSLSPSLLVTKLRCPFEMKRIRVGLLFLSCHFLW